MSGRWERTFEICVPVEAAWQAFTDPEYRRKLFAPPTGAKLRARNPEEGLRMLEVEPMKRLRWAQERADQPEKAEFTVVFESADHGSRITVTRCGFGEGEDADIFSTSNGLGWEHGFRDLVLFLETGQIVKRHYDGCRPSSMGMTYVETDGGLEVRRVAPEGFGAEVGLERGDRLVRVGRTGVYQRSDLWMVNGLFEPGTELEVEFVRGRELLRGRGRLNPVSERLSGE
jgi:uncharacterized protein YndB with AHSA1/START domain